MIKFICGCSAEKESDTVTFDNDGFIVCLVHHERRKGWRSLPTVGGKPDYSFSSWSPLEVERFMLFSEFPSNPTYTLNSAAEDRRDNRDPEALGREILAKSNSHGV